MIAFIACAVIAILMIAIWIHTTIVWITWDPPPFIGLVGILGWSFALILATFWLMDQVPGVVVAWTT